MVGMLQREVAERIASLSGSKVYGILSVLIQCYYSVELLMRVPPGVFVPPPKVESAVLRLRRNERILEPGKHRMLMQVVKQSFNQRRKTLRNSLRSLFGDSLPETFRGRRPEQLSVEEFLELTNILHSQKYKDNHGQAN
jgi:16S rRNA (adenine1518-N6/adenine1519-N6)-dimethyltransferase